MTIKKDETSNINPKIYKKSIKNIVIIHLIKINNSYNLKKIYENKKEQRNL